MSTARFVLAAGAAGTLVSLVLTHPLVLDTAARAAGADRLGLTFRPSAVVRGG